MSVDKQDPSIYNKKHVNARSNTVSVADIKSYRRKLKARQRIGHAPKKSGLSVSESIAKNRELARRQAKAEKKKK